jgi:SAM-dependent methyltransferase
MKSTDIRCELCSAIDWQPIGTRVYRISDCGPNDVYRFLRYRVLFEKWFPERTEIEFSCVACRRCGFVITIPRPERDDMDVKYRFLFENQLPKAVHIPFDAPIEKQRSAVLFNYLSRSIDLDRVTDVLDYGGADGRLMQAFLANGKSCHNIDYTENCIPGVVRLGDTLDDLGADHRFDLIICSHVMEHVVEPIAVIKQLATHLRPSGWIFVEVPMEIWRHAPLQHEPVTHINFYTPNSIYNMLTLSGLHVRQSRLTTFLHKKKMRGHAVRAVAQPAKDSSLQNANALRPSDLANYLNPGLRESLIYYTMCPSIVVRKIKRRLLGRHAAEAV